MGTAALDMRQPAVLPEPDRQSAQEASRAVARLIGRGAVRVEAVPVRDIEPAQTFILPAPVVQLLLDMLVPLGAGEPISVIPDQAELTTQQAADILGVSRPWIVKLIERGELSHRMVGTHRRVLFSDLRAYKDALQASRRRALDQLVADTQAMGTYE